MPIIIDYAIHRSPVDGASFTVHFSPVGWSTSFTVHLSPVDDAQRRSPFTVHRSTVNDLPFTLNLQFIQITQNTTKNQKKNLARLRRARIEARSHLPFTRSHFGQNLKCERYQSIQIWELRVNLIFLKYCKWTRSSTSNPNPYGEGNRIPAPKKSASGYVKPSFVRHDHASGNL